MAKAHTTDQWFNVHRKGLGALMEGRHPSFAPLELIQNGMDADGVTVVAVTLEVTDRGKARLRVQDDSPDGFHDLTHAYTLFAESEKKADPTKRGRFNLGEKLVLALCDYAEVESTTGAVHFNPDGTRTERSDRRREAGSVFDAQIRMKKQHVEETIAEMHRIIVPEGIELIVNGTTVPTRTPLHEFDCFLPTLTETDEGFRQTTRKTTVRVYEPLWDHDSTIYELGIPVVSIDSRYDVDVQQKVPLNMDRDNVTPAYLRKVRAEVANEMADRLTQEEATATWVTEAIMAPETTPETVKAIVTARFGENAVRYDPSDPEANKIAVSKGFTVVHGGSFAGAGWDKINEAGVLPKAGAVTPSWHLNTSPDGEDRRIDPADWTDGMRIVAHYARMLGEFLLGRSVDVTVVRYEIGEQVLAHYTRGGHLTFNLTRLGHRFFNERKQAEIDALLIHEFAHEHESDHFNHRFLDAACDLGAKMRHCRIGVEDEAHMAAAKA